MPSRTITVSGTTWHVVPSGLITQFTQDEFGLLFTREEGGTREVRVTRYSPVAARSREQSFAELSESDLQALFLQSQPSATSPEARYAR